VNRRGDEVASTTITKAPDRIAHGPVSTTVEIVVPVYNEERVLGANVRRLRSYLDERFPFTSLVTIADNASTDGTWGVATRLAAELPGVRTRHLPEKGRGRALRAVWSESSAEVVAYMDVDLATGLDGLLPLVAPLISGHSDVAIGTRLAHGARVQRGPKREIISRAYNLLIRTTMRSGFTDAQCGFKALRRAAADELLPLVADEGWFFDTELLLLAEANGMRIHEVPVDWVDDLDSRVSVVSTAAGDLRGLARVAAGLARGKGQVAAPTDLAVAHQATRFGGIGGLSTVAYVTLLLCLHAAIGLLAANAVALVAASAANAAAHAQLTLPGAPLASGGLRQTRRRFATEVIASLAAGLLLSTSFLVAVSLVSSGVAAYLAAAIVANAMVSVGRFVSFRARMFRRTASEARP
jgi:hypothetical protein